MPTIAQFRTTGLTDMVAGTLFFSIGAVLIKLTGQRLPALEVVFARSLVMAVYCYVLARRAGAYLPGHNKLLLFFRGALGFAAYFCIFYSIIHMPLADATVVSLSFPLIVPLWAMLFLGERLEVRTVLSIIFGAAGMLCVVRPGFLFSDLSSYAPLAIAAAVGAALLSSVSVTIIRKLTETDHPLVIVLSAAVAGTIGAPIIGAGDWLLPTAGEAAMLLGMGLCMSVGQHFVTVGYGKSPASKVSVLYYLEVIYAAVFGLLVFNELPDAMTIFGSVLIVGGAALLALRRQ